MVITTSVEGEVSQETNQQQGTFQQNTTPNDTALVNWQAEDFCGMNQTISQSVAANTRSKKRNIGQGHSLAPSDLQPSITPQGVGKQNTAPNMQGQPKPPSKPTQMSVVAAHAQERNVQAKGQQRDVSSAFNIIDQMKKTHANISMWESLSILRQRDLLQVAMKNWSTSNQASPYGHEKVLTNVAQLEGNHGGQQGKVLKPPPFYVSLIIGDKLVHNCMIDSGASSFVMPKQIADQLGLQYEVISKGVVQLDGTTVATVGVIKGLNLILHACPNVTVLQDVSVIDLPPLFALCLSRDFTAKIGGYLSVDWSHMIFRTRYGTKATIRSEPIVNFHIEPHVPSPINANCSAFDQEEWSNDLETGTKVEGIPYLTLDEWANKSHEFDPYKEIEESELGVYSVHEENSPIPDIMQPEQKDDNEVWQLFFDGSRSRQGVGGGAMLISPQDIKYYSAFCFQFSCSKNTTEYEALIHGLHWASKKGIKNLQVFGDSELIVNQVRGQHATKNDLLKSYKNRVWDLVEDFEAFNIVSIPRKKNETADRLASVGAMFDVVDNIRREKTQPHIHVIVRPAVPDNNTSWQVFENDQQIVNFLQEEAEFSTRNQDRLEQQYGDQVVQLRTNKLPKGLVTLESIFNPNDRFRKEKANIQVKREDSEPIPVGEGRTLRIGKVATEQEKSDFIQLCQEFPDVFAWSYEDLRGFNPKLAQHTIELDPDAKPIRKKNGEIRLCVDFRDLNRASLKDHYPLPSMEQILQVVSGSERFSLLDGYSGYNQVMVKEDDQFKTAFTTKWGTYAYKKMPFGLSNAGATFQRAMDMAFKGLINEIVLIYLDDITVFSKNAADHLFI
ncbi:hypothetical protein KI387_044243 [Taxus chinensis]|uniref:Uncharacterized protein n=1 Tax=Taxus chinensis TaxID=29808 RepID=A0AA38FBM9_TAXCH|nr:hypothetical protein KI387_044243 [Taxus chinensis]